MTRSVNVLEWTCSRCGATRPVTDFHIRFRATGERQTWCRDCMAAYKREWYLINRKHQLGRVKDNRAQATRINQDRAWAFLGAHPCVDCGETDPVILQFDHVRDKRLDVGYMLSAGFRWEVIEVEIAKCQVRCANCHRRKTAREQGNYDLKHSFRRVGEDDGFRWLDN